MVGGDPRLGRVVNLVAIFDLVPNLAFMADGVIEDCEKRLLLFAVLRDQSVKGSH